VVARRCGKETAVAITFGVAVGDHMSNPVAIDTDVALNGTLENPDNTSRSVAASGFVMTRRAEKSLETRTRILDGAEELFSKRGVDGVTLRDIAQLADVDTALLHYYFDSKRGIFESVLARRAAVLQYEVGESLSRYARQANGAVSLEGAIAAYLHPIFRLVRTGGREWRNYCSLVLQLGDHSEWVSDTVAAYFDPIAERLLEILRRGLPNSAEADLHWGYQMLARVLTLAFTLDNGIERLSGGACRAGDLEAMEPRMVRFAAAGIRATCETQDRETGG
jgi:AcrR family transcriptional regulator